MEIWHLTPETPRFPYHVSGGESVNLKIGTWPVEPGQRVWIEFSIVHADGSAESGRSEGTWNFNLDANSYWFADFGPFRDDDRADYRVRGESGSARAEAGPFAFRVGPKIHLALLWHQHQPLYRNLRSRRAKGSYVFPWVRLRSLRDYYAMAALAEDHPDVRLTINLTPVLLWQIEDYAERGATDRALDLTQIEAERLTVPQRDEILETFFDADWHNQIYPWPRYKELFEKRAQGRPFSADDLRDIQMWFNLAWFAPEFQEREVALPDGSVASVRGFVEKGRDYTRSDLEAMVAEQRKILRNVIAIHRRLAERGQVEISTTPFFHPILPLVADTDRATLDRDGASLPRRFSRPEDAAEQVRRGVTFYRERFGNAPAGMWPAEGAVGQSVVSFFTDVGLRWIASDRGVLERSGRYGYDVGDPNVLCRPYRAEDESDRGVACFFRDTELSDRIGFHYHRLASADEAAGAFVREVKERFAWRVDDPAHRILTVALDGENAWGAYPHLGRPFLHALYAALAADPEIRTVTFAEYLAGNPTRRVAPHPVETLEKVHDLFHASWIDESGSRPGNDLGTWIGEPEENQAWELLTDTREFLDRVGATPEIRPEAFEAVYAAEGSDWFWWFGMDQASGSDAEFDDLFRSHLGSACLAAGQRPLRKLDAHIVPHAAVWTFARRISSIQAADCLVVRTHCPGDLEWRSEEEPTWKSASLVRAGGAVTGLQRFGLTLGPFPARARAVEFRFHCRHPGCRGSDPCCRADLQRVEIVAGECDDERDRASP